LGGNKMSNGAGRESDSRRQPSGHESITASALNGKSTGPCARHIIALRAKAATGAMLGLIDRIFMTSRQLREQRLLRIPHFEARSDALNRKTRCMRRTGHLKTTLGSLSQ
jgi:hypothetical protein